MTTAFAAIEPGLRESTQPRVMTVRVAPRREPPFDDELPDVPVGRYDQPLPFLDARFAARAVEIRPRPDPDLPDPARWARTLLVAVIEMANGHRSPQQLGALFSAVLAHRIGTDLVAAGVRNRRHWLHAASIRSVRAMQPRAGIAEITATVDVGQRVRAVALRAERRDGRWSCTRLQLG
jgi:hypothetical protein